MKNKLRVYTFDEKHRGVKPRGGLSESYIVTFMAKLPNGYWEQRTEQYFTESKFAHNHVQKRWENIHCDEIKNGTIKKEPIRLIYQ